MSTISPLQMAQFFSLPGAAELVEAFSALEPGPVRDSIVHHAQVLAQASGWTPPVPFGMQPPPLQIAARPPKLTSPFAEGLAAQSLEGQIIERLMRGEADHLVADDLGVKLGALVRLKKKARREGGLVFPGDADSPTGDDRPWKSSAPKGKGLGRGHGKNAGKTLNLPRMPVPAPPYWWQDPASPVWDNPRLLPTYSESAVGTLGALGPLDYRNYRTMTLAAERHGLTLRQHIAQRLEIIRRIEAGEKPTELALAMRINPYAIYSLLTAIGRGRMETLNARPLEAREPDPLPQPIREPRPAPARPRRTPRRTPDAAEATAQAVRERAAEKWGFANVAAYEQMREQVRDLRLSGVERAEIVERLDMPPEFVKSVVQNWQRQHGIVFPTVVLGGKVRAA